ncbi:MAG: hypothetical protein F6J93_22205 [Oscillatoria sp. SIO1A7]|nr:hypothetical protein [Oscillatoria sp. SIO1A7]
MSNYPPGTLLGGIGRSRKVATGGQLGELGPVRRSRRSRRVATGIESIGAIGTIGRIGENWGDRYSCWNVKILIEPSPNICEESYLCL